MANMASVLGLLAAVLAAAPAIWLMSRTDHSTISVIVVTLDTTRADRLAPYGLMDVSMPALEQLASEGVVFDRATSVAPLTLPAHASLFTGLYPMAHGVADNNGDPLSTGHLTLAEIFQQHGFRTGAFVSSVVLNAERGLAQGFDTYRDIAPAEERRVDALQRRADTVITDAIDWLDRIGDSKFFLWAHLYDPHRPYDPPEPYRSRFTDPYVGEIAFTDSQLGRLIDVLRRRSLLDRTIIVIAGDHGESLGEHGERDHGIFLYESVVRVPLIVRAPGIAPARIGSLVRLVDVMPTLLDQLDIEVPAIDGVSLRGLMHGTVRDLDLEAYAESMYPLRLGWSPLRSIRSGRYKFIDAPRPELYDLSADPFEAKNLYDEHRRVANVMARRLRTLLNTGYASRATVPAGPEHLSVLLKTRIATLGYVSTPQTDGWPRGPALPDPKDCLYREATMLTALCTSRGMQ